jgi:hypothetical protein
MSLSIRFPRTESQVSEPDRSLLDMGAVVDDAVERARRVSEGGGEPVQVLACDDGIRVTAVPPGTVTIEILEPRSLKLGSDEVGEALTKAVNEALQRLRESANGAGAIDPAALAEQFAEISADARTSFSELLDSVVRLQRPDAER